MNRFLFLLAAVLTSLVVWAAEPVVCTVDTATGSSASTASPTTGTCSWGKGAVVLIQCSTDTYVDSTTITSPYTVPSATSADQAVDFTNNKDPYPLYLGQYEQIVAVRAVSTAGSCKFMTTQRRKPF